MKSLHHVLQQSLLSILPLFLLFLNPTQHTHAYTYEPPGRDPVSVDKIRSSEQAVQLTTENFDELTKGKMVFIKFFAPYCPHCNEMAKAWNELAMYYNEESGRDDVLIGSIDCTNSPHGKNLCAKFKIMGLPTLMFGDASYSGVYLEEYGGGKTFGELKAFALEALLPQCTPGNLDACSSDDRNAMQTYMAMSYGQLNAKIESTVQKLQELEEAFSIRFKELQKVYDGNLLEKELQNTETRRNIKLIKEVMALK